MMSFERVSNTLLFSRQLLRDAKLEAHLSPAHLLINMDDGTTTYPLTVLNSLSPWVQFQDQPIAICMSQPEQRV